MILFHPWAANQNLNHFHHRSTKPTPRHRQTIRVSATGTATSSIYAVSDVHSDYQANFDWCQSLDPIAYKNDILLVAGDVCDDLGLLKETLSLFVDRFRGGVFYVPGNHELWIRSSDKHAGILDSWTKFNKILEICNDVGVYTTSCTFGENEVQIIPLMSWHHASFDSEPDVPSVPKASPLTIADYGACVWEPDTVYHSVHGCIELAQRFDALNDAHSNPKSDYNTERTRNSNDPKVIITVSHFLPRIELLPEKRFLFFPNLPKASGSIPLQERIKAIQPDIHIFGHTHFSWDQELDGTRFIQAPLGSPSERMKRLKTIGFDANTKKNGGKMNRIGDGNSGNSDHDPLAATWLPVEIYRFSRFQGCVPAPTQSSSDTTVTATIASQAKEALAPVKMSNVHVITTEESAVHTSPFSSNSSALDVGISVDDNDDNDSDQMFTRINQATHVDIATLQSENEEATSTLGEEEVPRGFENNDDTSSTTSITSSCHTTEAEDWVPLGDGYMAPPLKGAHWSEYYRTHPRTPENTRLAPWVAHVYERRQRRQKSS